MASSLKPGLGNTAGNKYTSPGPGRRLPGPDKPKKKKRPVPKGYVGAWTNNPGLSPKKFKTVKTGAGYYVAKPIKLKGGKGGVGGKGKGKGETDAQERKRLGPPPVPGPYDKYKGTAYEGYFEQQDRDALHHQNYVGNTVMPQLSAGLAALTGVNPAAPGYNPVIQQQYLANVAGSVGNALNASAAATPAQFQSSSPGGITAAPNAYQGQAMREYAGQRAGSAILNAQAQSALNTLQPNIYAQAALSRVADYAKGLPQVYAERRSAEMLKVDQYMAEAAEEARHNKVTEAISGMNAKTNAAIQFGRLGLDATGQVIDANSDAADRAATTARNNADNATSLANNAANNATSRANNAASNAASGSPSGGSPSGGKPINVNQLRKEGFVGGYAKKPKKLPKGAKSNWTKGSDGRWYVKPGSAAGPSTVGADNKPKNVTTLQGTLRGLYTGTGGWGEVDDPAVAADQVTRWIYENRKYFMGPNRKVLTKKIRDVMTPITGVNGAVGTGIRRGLGKYFTPDGRWK